ncbi:MAG: copper chaperone PCu(A)C [Roseovarius sp.]
MKPLIAATLALALPTLVAAHEYSLGGIEIDHPMAYETAATAKSGGGYVTITNNGETDDTLIGAKADFPKVQIHESYEEDGVARMRHVERLAVPAGETVELAPGGFHVMFMGLPGPFETGTEIPVTLVFEEAGEIEVMFHVEERSGDAHDHSGH